MELSDKNQKELDACLARAQKVAEKARPYGAAIGGGLMAIPGITAGVFVTSASPLTAVVGAIGGGIAGTQRDHGKGSAVVDGAVGAFVGAGIGAAAPGVTTTAAIIGAGAEIGGQFFVEMRRENEEGVCYSHAIRAELASPKTPKIIDGETRQRKHNY